MDLGRTVQREPPPAAEINIINTSDDLNRGRPATRRPLMVMTPS
jgi:hypothetical protein